ncbi:MAG: hypothetical protein ACKOKF_06385 [Bacteroidota bacterium]
MRETAEQVIRDFQSASIEITFSGDPFRAYDELLEQLEPLVKSLIKEEPSRLSSLLYRIDISEKDFRKVSQGPERFRQLAELILQREFKKVLIRHYFKSNQG